MSHRARSSTWFRNAVGGPVWLRPNQRPTAERSKEVHCYARGVTKEQLEIHLRYEGPDVNDGTMSVEDIVPVLQGFSSAYGKLASTADPQSTHRLRIAAVR